MLETIREHARELRDAAGETQDRAIRHAHYFLEKLEENEAEFQGHRHSEIVAWFMAEEDNLRAMLDRLCGIAPEDAVHAADLLRSYWLSRGALAEARNRYRALLDGQLPAESRVMLLNHLADMEDLLGDFHAAEAATREALIVAEDAGDRLGLAKAQMRAATSALNRGRTEDAVSLAHRAVEQMAELDQPTRVRGRLDLGVLLAEAGRTEEARAVLRSVAAEARNVGDLALVETMSALNLGFVDLIEHEYTSAYTVFASTRADSKTAGNYMVATFSLWGAGTALLGLGRQEEARAAFSELLEIALATEASFRAVLALAMAGIALSADGLDATRAARLRGAVSRLRQDIGGAAFGVDEELDSRFEQPLIRTLGREPYDAEFSAGMSMTNEEAIELARSLSDS